MHVLATAGHVDHGKSTLVRALTGMEPDRLAEEQRRGLTVDLGYAWTTLPNGEDVAFVDVPGHQRFIANMLAGIGPVPAVLFVVAADEGWAAQSNDHLAALDALHVEHGLLVITRSDRADPDAALADGQRRLARSSLGRVDTVSVSATTGAGLDRLRSALQDLVASLPQPRSDSPVRFWIDRSFTIRGAGTVVTGTLSAGAITQGDHLALGDRDVTVRGIQVDGRRADHVRAVSRVALNLRGTSADAVRRGDVLLTPREFLTTPLVDVRITGGDTDTPRIVPRELVLHVGTAAVPVAVRNLGPDLARLRLERPLPLRAGDRGVLRDPGQQSVTGGIEVLDADPPAFSRRGDPRRRGMELSAAGAVPDVTLEVARRGAVPREHLRRLGFDTTLLPDSAGWLVSNEQRDTWLAGLVEAVDDWAARHPLEPAIPHEALRRAVGLPDVLLPELVAACGLLDADGRIRRVDTHPSLGRRSEGLETLKARLVDAPFAAPDQDELRRLGLGPRELALAVKRGDLLRIADGIVLAPDAAQRAVRVLAGLGEAFTLSIARQALGTTRRVAVPLLEHLDDLELTVRVDSVTRRIVADVE